MTRRELHVWLLAIAAIFVAAAATVVLKQDGGYQHFLHILDWAEVTGTVFLAALGTFLTIWHSSIFFGLLFVIATVLVLSRTGRLRFHAGMMTFFAIWIGLPCVFAWHMTRQHLSVPAGLLVGLFWLTGPPVLYFCIRHAVIRRAAAWSVRDRRIAYSAAALTFVLASLWAGTVKSDREVERSIFTGSEIVYAIKDYHMRNHHLPGRLQDLVPAYFSRVPETEVPEGWSGHEDYVYETKGRHRFTVAFESASYANCLYDRSEDRWDCK